MIKKLICKLIAAILISIIGIAWVISTPDNVMQQIYYAVYTSTSFVWVYVMYHICSD